MNARATDDVAFANGVMFTLRCSGGHRWLFTIAGARTISRLRSDSTFGRSSDRCGDRQLADKDGRVPIQTRQSARDAH
jgi:hypothetical protein